MSYMDQRMKDALDRWITGNYGEDQFKSQRKEELDEEYDEEYEDFLDQIDFELDPEEDR